MPLLTKISRVALALSILVMLGTWLLSGMSSRHPERSFRNAVNSSDLGSLDKRVLNAISLDSATWTSGLIEKLGGTFTFKRIVWNAEFVSEGRIYYVFLFDEFVRPVADSGIPLICVITDEQFRLQAWKEVAIWSRGFVDASIVTNGSDYTLSITTNANWFKGVGIYEYVVSIHGVESRGNEKFKERKERVPLHVFPRPKSLTEFMKQGSSCYRPN